MTELPKAYTPRDVEGAIYERWLAADVFAPDGAASGPASPARSGAITSGAAVRRAASEAARSGFTR